MVCSRMPTLIFDKGGKNTREGSDVKFQMQYGTVAHENPLHSTLFKQVHPLMINTITLLIPAPRMPALTGSQFADE